MIKTLFLSVIFLFLGCKTCPTCICKVDCCGKDNICDHEGSCSCEHKPEGVKPKNEN